jgi:hypothetical protein
MSVVAYYCTFRQAVHSAYPMHGASHRAPRLLANLPSGMASYTRVAVYLAVRLPGCVGPATLQAAVVSGHCTCTDQGQRNVSWDFRTILPTFFLKPSRSSRHCLAASMLAGDSSLGDDSIEMMLSMIVSTCTSGVEHCLLQLLQGHDACTQQ